MDNHTLVKDILGAPATKLFPNMYEDFFVPSSFRFTTVWLGNDALWSGILDKDVDEFRLDKVKDALPDVEIRESELEAGIHY